MVQVFMTSNGSVYTIYEENTSKRYKTVENTLYRQSSRTVYLNHQEARWVSTAIACGGWVKYEDNKFYVTLTGRPDDERPYTTEPKIDLYPFEFWGEDLRSPEYVHLGNEIENIF
jgi:hypothetical protein